MINTVLSNRIEELLQRCMRTLRDVGGRPLVLVPDSFLKSYLQLELAKQSSSHTLFAIDILPLEMGLKKLLFANGTKPFAEMADCVISSLHHDNNEPQCMRIAHFAHAVSCFGLESTLQPEIEKGVRQIINDPHLRHLCNEKWDTLNTVYTHVYLFGISSLPAFYHQLLSKISHTIAVFSYVLSPCMMFWTDMRIKKDVSEIEPFYDHHPLLANCGKVGRDYARLLEDSPHEYEEAYIIPDWVEKARPDAISGVISCKKSALNALQADLLLLRENTEPYSDDDTIQIHAAPTLLGEVQALQRALSEIIDPIDASDILILAPDIQLYRPYLERVFDEGQFHVYEKREFALNGILDGFFTILQLFGSRWKAIDVLKLFQCNAIVKKLGLQKEDATLLKTCMQRLGVYWGVTLEQKSSLLGESELYAGTFQEFQEAFLQLWITNQHPKVEITASDAEKIGVCLNCIFSLYALNFTELTLTNAAMLLEKLLEEYFFVDADDTSEYFSLVKAIQSLKKRALHSPDLVISPKMITTIVRECLNECMDQFDCMPKGMISCASIGQFRAKPFKVIAFLGMNEANFPRHFSSYALDKHLFLEALISARSHVILCYQNYDFEQQSALNPSSAVMDLLDNCKACIVSHSIDSYEMHEKLPVQKSHFFDSKVSSEPIFEYSISYLNKVARSPLTPYFQKQGVTFFEEMQQDFGNEFATLTSKLHNQVKKTAFFLSNDAVDAFVLNEYKHLPRSLQRAYYETVKRDQLQLQAHAKQLGIIDSKRSFSITFSHAADTVCEVASGVWHVPAITINGKCVTGTVEHLHEMGHFAFFGKDNQAIVSLWPRLIVTAYASRYYGIAVSSDVLFLQTGVKHPIHFDDPKQSLKEFLDYAELCSQTPMCLYPDWFKALISSDSMPETLLDKTIYDSYLQFYITKNDRADIQANWSTWHTLAKKLFQPLVEVSDEL